MNASSFHLRAVVWLAAVLAFCLPAAAITFTNDTAIGIADASYDGVDIVVSNCVLTVDGPHTFSSVQIGGGGVMTHTFAPDGVLLISHTNIDEPQTLIGTDAVTLAYPGTLTSYVVTDTNKTITYEAGADYVLTNLTTNGSIQLWRTPASAIPDGATVLVTYALLVVSAPAGLSLLVTGDMEIAPGGAINVDGRGYGGGKGPGHSYSTGPLPQSGPGGSYGGSGGSGSSGGIVGMSYGSMLEPTNLGSSGGSGATVTETGASGGGSIRLAVDGILLIDGVISANGYNATNNRSGGGSGGSIWLTAQTITGTGLISADGGAGEPVHGGGGGGGRIALYSKTNLFSGSLANRGGVGFVNGGAGTMYVKPTDESGGWVALDNGGRTSGSTFIQVTNAADLLLAGGVMAIATGPLTIGNLVVYSNCQLAARDQQAMTMTVTGDATVQSDGSILLDRAGYPARTGPGAGGTVTGSTNTWGGGGGHGGYGAGIPSSSVGSGGHPAAPGGDCYGLPLSPGTYGSGGGGTLLNTNVGGAGGGVINFNVLGTLTLDGSISADGGSAIAPGGGGGSGGSVCLAVGTLAGSGLISANGGNGVAPYGGGGGGGRIAVEFDTNLFNGTMRAHGGGGAGYGGAGTVFLIPGIQTPSLLADNGGNAGTNTPMSLSTGYALSVRGGARVTVSGSSTFPSLLVGSNSCLFLPGTQPVPLVVNGNASIEKGGIISASALGYAANSGMGSGRTYTSGTNIYGGGGGHGGYGGSGAHPLAYGGTTYGSSAQLYTVGSGGGGYDLLHSTYAGGAGGGIVSMTVNGTLTLEGEISADGGSYTGSGGGGGSGGSVALIAAQLSGAGAISANGGNGNLPNGGGGGGGRISVRTPAPQANAFAGTMTAFGGAGANRGGAGVVITQTNNQPAEVWIDNGGEVGTNTPVAVEGAYGVSITGGAQAVLPVSAILGTLLVGSNSALYGSGSVSPSSLTITGNATVEPNGRISFDAMGYPSGNGPGAGRTYSAGGTNYGGGGGHGGYGASGAYPYAFGGNSYESSTSPVQPGSGGGGYASPNNMGGSGGGALGLTVNGMLVLNGSISANGGAAAGSGGGGGSGGTVWLHAGVLAGSGLISANGGAGSIPNGGGGGGGRIAITSVSNFFTGSITAYGGTGGRIGGAGTIYTARNAQGPARLLLDNADLSGTNTPISDSGSYQLTITRGAIGSTSTSGGFSVSSLNITSNGWLAVVSQPLSVIGSATIQAGGGITANGAGYPSGSGPGAGRSAPPGPGGGGGHGGYGAANLQPGGGAYDSVQTPSMPGSGGGSGYILPGFPSPGGSGGGVVRLLVSQTLTVDGSISADGTSGSPNSGGGSGGSIWVTAQTLGGRGTISANGGPGDGAGGGGGGGRVSITFSSNSYSGAVTSFGGEGRIGGGAGTIYLNADNRDVGRLLVSNGGLVGTNTPLSTSFGLPTQPFDLAVQGEAAVSLFSAIPLLSNLVVNTGGLVSSLPQDSVNLAVLGDAMIGDGAAISVDGKGYPCGNGPGAGATYLGEGGGGGYGGAGGMSSAGAVGGTSYGSAGQPVDLGSGGGIGAILGGSEGGGAIRLTVGGTLTVNGRLGANGNPGVQDNSGGGSGGSIWVAAGALTGDGVISANGGAGELYNGGGGGGGRIALYSPSNTFTGLVTASGGAGAMAGSDGTTMISVPAIQGTVTDANGTPVAGVLLQNNVGFPPVTSDENGRYTLGFVLGSTFTVTPSLAGYIFAPGSRTYGGLNASVTDADYVAVTTIAPTLGSGLQGTNLFLSWHGLPGVTYQLYSSTNLLDWQSYGDPMLGSNAPVEIPLPIEGDPQRYFRVDANN